jgi:hypothetical protein
MYLTLSEMPDKIAVVFLHPIRYPQSEQTGLGHQSNQGVYSTNLTLIKESRQDEKVFTVFSRCDDGNFAR